MYHIAYLCAVVVGVRNLQRHSTLAPPGGGIVKHPPVFSIVIYKKIEIRNLIKGVPKHTHTHTHDPIIQLRKKHILTT